MAGPTGALARMTGPAGVGVTSAGVAVAGSTAGVGVRGFRTTARVTTAPAGIAVASSTAGGIGMRSPRITGMTATGIRMRGRRIRCRVRGSRPIAGMTGSAGVAVTGLTGAAGVAGAGVGVAGPAAGVGVRGFGTAARVDAAPAGVGVAGPAGAGVAGAAGVGAGGGVGGCCGGVGGLGSLGVGMAGDGIETVISSHARTSTSRRGVGRCSRHCWNGARERIQTMISPRTRPGRRALVTTATGGRARFGFPALGADPTITASARARARPSRLTTVTAAGRLTTGRLTAVPSGVMPAAGVRMTRPG